MNLRRLISSLLLILIFAGQAYVYVASSDLKGDSFRVISGDNEMNDFVFILEGGEEDEEDEKSLRYSQKCYLKDEFSVAYFILRCSRLESFTWSDDCTIYRLFLQIRSLRL